MSYKFDNKLGNDWFDLVTDCLESRFRSGRPRSARASDGGGPGSDLLYSFMKLQAAQMNHFARIGLAQTEYARRAFEAFYGTRAPACYRDEDEAIRVTGPVKGHASGKFIVKNTTDAAGSFQLTYTCFSKVGGPEEFNHTFDVHPDTTSSVPAGGDVVVKVEIPIDEKLFMAGRCYETVITASFGGKVVKRIAVILEVT
jgi:hypothetical protein